MAGPSTCRSKVRHSRDENSNSDSELPKEYNLKDIALHLSLNEGTPDIKIQSYIGISRRSMQGPTFLKHGGKKARVARQRRVKPVTTERHRLLDTLDASASILFFIYDKILIFSFLRV